MNFRRFAGALLLLLPMLAHGYDFLPGYETAGSVAAALERIKTQPDKHVLVYVGMSEFCPPCKQMRAVLNSERVRSQWQPNYVVVTADMFAPTPEEREIIKQLGVSWAPVLVFLNGAGKRVAYARLLGGEKEALELNAFVSQRQYAQSAFERYAGQDFSTGSAGRITPLGPGAARSGPIDDRPRLRDALAQKYQRVPGDALKKLLAGKRMHKENQDWFLVMDLLPRNGLLVSGDRKNGRGKAKGIGSWYVTKKGKLCIEFNTDNVDENWCRIVFRAGEGYYAVKDLRPERLAYRFSLEDL